MLVARCTGAMYDMIKPSGEKDGTMRPAVEESWSASQAL
jgi:hypothetical protein